MLGSKTQKNAPSGYLIGDSNARNYLIAARKILPSFDIKYMTMGHGCAFLPSSLISNKLDKNASCNQYSKSVASLIAKESRRGDIVFIGQALKGSAHNKRAVQEYFDHIKIFANTLASKSIPVVIFDGIYPSLPPELCMKEVWRPFPNCERNIDEVRSAYNRFDELAVSLSNSSDNIYYAPLRLGLVSKRPVGDLLRKEHQFGIAPGILPNRHLENLRIC